MALDDAALLPQAVGLLLRHQPVERRQHLRTFWLRDLVGSERLDQHDQVGVRVPLGHVEGRAAAGVDRPAQRVVARVPGAVPPRGLAVGERRPLAVGVEPVAHDLPGLGVVATQVQRPGHHQRVAGIELGVAMGHELPREIRRYPPPQARGPRRVQVGRRQRAARVGVAQEARGVGAPVVTTPCTTSASASPTKARHSA